MGPRLRSIPRLSSEVLSPTKFPRCAPPFEGGTRGALLVERGSSPALCHAVDRGGGHRGAKAIVDIDDRDARGAGVEHAQERGEAAKARAITHRGGHGDDDVGFGQLGVVNALINSYLDGNAACYIAFSQPLNVLYLVNDGGPGSGAGP